MPDAERQGEVEDVGLVERLRQTRQICRSDRGEAPGWSRDWTNKPREFMADHERLAKAAMTWTAHADMERALAVKYN